jgi:hypothetical protein
MMRLPPLPLRALAALSLLSGGLAGATPPDPAADPPPRGPDGRRYGGPPPVRSLVVPRPGLVLRDRRYDDAYRLLDDRVGVSSGSRFERIEARVQRGGFRIRGDARDIVIRDVTLSLVEPTHAPELPAGIEIQGTAHDILVEDVTASGFRMVPRPGRYTNGDGVSSERGAYRLTFRRVDSVDNSDGGFDLKSTDTRLIDTRAARNGISYRLWGSGEADRIESIDPRQAHVQLKTQANWHIRRLVARATTRAPVFVIVGDATLTVDSCELDLPPGTPLVRVENGARPQVKWGRGCVAAAPDR